MAGTIANVSHYGDVLQYVVRTSASSGSRDVISMLPRQGAPRLAPGDEVWCHWAAEDVYMFSAAQADLVLADSVTNPAVA
jgi:spermidine/putrescine transport system ATP-binding protein